VKAKHEHEELQTRGLSSKKVRKIFSLCFVVLIRKKLHFTNEMWHAAAHAQIGLVYYRFVKEK